MENQNKEKLTLVEKINAIRLSFKKPIAPKSFMTIGGKKIGYADKAQVWDILRPEIEKHNIYISVNSHRDYYDLSEIHKLSELSNWKMEKTTKGFLSMLVIKFSIKDIDFNNKRDEIDYLHPTAAEMPSAMFTPAAMMSYGIAQGLINIFWIPINSDGDVEKADSSVEREQIITGKTLREMFDFSKTTHQALYLEWQSKNPGKGKKDFLDNLESVSNNSKLNNLFNLLK